MEADAFEMRVKVDEYFARVRKRLKKLVNSCTCQNMLVSKGE